MVGSVVFQESMALIYILFVLLDTTEAHLGPTKIFFWGVGVRYNEFINLL